MNVVLCISKVGSIKYLFKYVYKGHDRVTVEKFGGDTDETGGKLLKMFQLLMKYDIIKMPDMYIGFRSSVEAVLIPHSGR